MCGEMHYAVLTQFRTSCRLEIRGESKRLHHLFGRNKFADFSYLPFRRSETYWGQSKVAIQTFHRPLDAALKNRLV